MALVIKGVLHGTGDHNLILIDGMFWSEADADIPSTWLLPVSGSYTNCTRVGADTLFITNPVSVGTFSFPVYWTMNEVDWYTTIVSGTSYHSLGATNIALSGVRNEIGETTYSLATMCASANVNRYAEFCPNGSSPYRLGDFRWYAHLTPGGSSIRGNAQSTADWGETVTIEAYASRVFKEISGKPYSSSRIVIYEGASLVATSSTVNLNTSFGIRLSYTKAGSTSRYATETVVTYTVKCQHYYGSSWVDGDTEEVNITFAGNPFAYARSSVDLDGDTLYLTFTHNSTLDGYTVRLSISGSTATDQKAAGASPTNMAATDSVPLPSPCTWVLDVYYNLEWVQLDSDTTS